MQTPRKLAGRARGLGQVWRKFRMPIVVILIVIGVAVTALHFNADQREQSPASTAAPVGQTATAAARAMAKHLKSAVSKVLDPIDRASLAALLAAGDEAAIAQRSQALLTTDGLVKAARLLPKGYSATDYKSNPPLSYATLELMRQVDKTGKRPAVEALFHGDKQRQHLAVVEPLKVNGEVVGYLVLALDNLVLKQSIKAVNVRGAYIEVSQRGGEGKSLVVAKKGQVGARKGPPAATAKVSGSAWRVRVWPVVKSAAATVEPPMMPIVGAVFALLLAGVGFVWWRKRKASAVDGPDPATLAKEVPLAAKLAALKTDPSAGAATVAQKPEEMVEESSSAVALEPVNGDGAQGFDSEAAAADAADTGRLELRGDLFRPCEVRGVVDEELTADSVHALGRAIGSEAAEREHRTLVVACDARASSPGLVQALIEGLRSTGRDVIDIGQVPTPVMYYATKYLNTDSGVMVTGSHGSMNENGLVVVLGGETLAGEALARLRQRVAEGNFSEGQGTSQTVEVIDEYVRRISEDIPVALGSSYRVVLDCANGVAGAVAPKAMRTLGHDVVELHCDTSESFPHQATGPSDPDNLRDLAAAVIANEADIGFAFDADGTRLGVMDGAGKVISTDRQMMLFAADMLSRNAGAEIVFDVKCSARLAQVIKAKGGKPVLSRTGHAFMKRRIAESDAPLAGEASGRVYFNDRWYGFEDATYAAARMLEILMGLNRKPTDVLARLPAVVSTPDHLIAMPDEQAAAVVAKLKESSAFGEGKPTTVDGLRIDYADGFGVVRASTVRPALSIRFAANDETALGKVKDQFRTALAEAAPDLELPF